MCRCSAAPRSGRPIEPRVGSPAPPLRERASSAGADPWVKELEHEYQPSQRPSGTAITSTVMLQCFRFICTPVVRSNSQAIRQWLNAENRCGVASGFVGTQPEATAGTLSALFAAL